MEMVTTAVAVVGAKGGCAATSAAVLAAFGLADALAGGQRPVMADCTGDIALTLDIGEEIAGISEVAAGEVELRDALWDLVEDADSAAAMPLFMGRGLRRSTPEQVAAVAASLAEAGFVPVLDCGAGRDAVPLLSALEASLLVSRIVTLVATPAAANAAAALGPGGPGARRVLYDQGDGLVSAEEFASVFPVDATIGVIPQWHDWQMSREVPQQLVRAAGSSEQTPAGTAIAVLTALLVQPTA